MTRPALEARNEGLRDRLHAEANNYALHEDVRALLDEASRALAPEPAPINPPDLEQGEREALNYIAASMRDRNAKRAVDKALVLCDHYAGRNQLTFVHRDIHRRMIHDATPPAVSKPWQDLIGRIAALVNCVPSDNAHGNEHVVKGVETLAAIRALSADRGEAGNRWRCKCGVVNPTFDPWCSACNEPQPEQSADSAAPSHVSDTDASFKRAHETYAEKAIHTVSGKVLNHTTCLRAALEAAQPQPGRVEGMDGEKFRFIAKEDMVPSREFNGRGGTDSKTGS